jgi:hypothetical protein
MSEARRRLFAYYMRVAQFIAELDADSSLELELWRELHPEASDLDWPEISKQFGRRPGRGPALIEQIRRTA